MHVIDVYNDKKWVNLVKTLVADVVQPEHKVGLIGHFKDESSYYLELFPEWEMVEIDSLEDAMSATPMREAFYRGEIWEDRFPQGTIEFLQKFKQSAIYQQLQHKYQTQDKSNLE